MTPDGSHCPGGPGGRHHPGRMIRRPVASGNLGGMTRTRRLAAATAVLLLGGSGLSACGGKPAVCDDVAALQQSMSKIKDAKVGQNALDTLTNESANIKAQLQKLGKDASAQYSSQVDKVKSTSKALSTSVRTASTNPTSATFTAVSDDAKALGAAVNDLADAVSGTC
jgi:hypothetical protein